MLFAGIKENKKARIYRILVDISSLLYPLLVSVFAGVW